MTGISRRSLLGYGGRALLAAGAAGAAAPLLTACSGSSGSDGPVNITYQYMAFVNAPDQGLVQQAVNAYLKKLGRTFTVTLAPVLNYDQKMTLNMSAGNVGDAFFTAAWANDFFKNAGGGNLMALDDLLPKYAPKLYASMPQSLWQGAKVNGKIYGVINQQRFPKLWGVCASRAMADKYDLDVDSLTGFADLEPWLAKVKAGERDIIVWGTDVDTTGSVFYPEIHGLDPIATAYGLAVRYDDAQRKVINVYTTDEYRAAAELMYRWHQLGYTTKDPLSDADRASKQHAGSIAGWPTQAPPTNPQLESFPTVSKSFVAKPLLNTDGVSATLTGISADTDHAQEVMEFLELLNSDKYLYNLICFGIEGKDYVVADKTLGVVGFPQGVTSSNDRYNPNLDWQFGNQFNAYYRTEDDARAKRWEVEKALNASASPSVALGFSLDTTNLRTQVSTVSAAIKEYQQQVAIGLVDPGKGIAQFLERLNQAGMPALLEAAQQQMDTWAKGK